MEPTVSLVQSNGNQDQGSAPLNFGDEYTGLMSAFTVISAGFMAGYHNNNTGPGNGITPNTTPEPVSVLILGTGVASLAIRRRKNRS